ncbi:MarC family protein [uncultured Thalassolituus sp.]|uniref:MarC family protein n=1 Tax=uncultured Thalassolituus sp. TaxID=285273 RepID=UPI00261904B9|nr:MarC family protein [uncultured Thalassolituus sp.]
MGEIAAVTLATLFATVSPIDISAIFAALTNGMSAKERKRTAVRAVVIATIVLLLFAFLGEALLNTLGISLASLRTAGGIILLLIGIEMVFARSSGASSTTEQEDEEALERHDVSVFPMALPLIAGPGSMGAVMLMMAHASGLGGQLTVVACVLLIMLLTLVCLLAATPITRLLGVTGMQVIMRVMGVLLCALAVQFIFDGIGDSGLLSGQVAAVSQHQ